MEELSNYIVIVLILLALFLSFSIGANDETPAPLAAAGTLKFKSVLILGGVGLAIGTIFLSEEVASTVGKKFVGEDVTYTIYMLLSVLISAIVWLIIGSFSGIPLSSTHSLFGSIFGVIIVFISLENINISGAFNWEIMISIGIGWLLSPVVGFLLTYLFYKIIAKYFLNRFKGLNSIEKSENSFSWALLLAVFGVSIYTGANSAEALGIIYALFDENYLNLGAYWFWKVFLGIFALLGIYIAGRFVIKNLASQTTDARPSEGFILQLATFIVLFVVTPLGIPISHSHVIVFCIIGLNVAKKQEVDYRGIGKMALYWFLTLPISALVGGLVYFGFYVNGFH
ncbi:MAG: inorganic phosphate transporter [Candidatus Lokiarchaeota archaeon]|nr:inorganic phosphate transporter [Candidatus Lokiarchaeota archaeon]